MRSYQVEMKFGVSQRSLQWWDEKGLVSPPIVGHARDYTPWHLMQVALVAELRKRGASLLECRFALKELTRMPAARWIVLNARRRRAHGAGSADEALRIAASAGPVYIVAVRHDLLGAVENTGNKFAKSA